MTEEDQLIARANALFAPAVAAEVVAQIRREAAVDRAEFAVRKMATAGAASASGMCDWPWPTFGRAAALYAPLGVGDIRGRIRVTWNGVDGTGADSFLYEPDPADPFRYVTAENRTITPQRMLTDAGSVHTVFRVLDHRATPWRFAPAYFIHDWLFVAKKCRHAPDADLTFEQTADIMAEVMKTMMEKPFPTADGKSGKFDREEDIVYMMHTAVTSTTARTVWDDDSTVVCLR